MFSVLAPRLATPADVPGVSEDHVAVVEALRTLPYQQRETLTLFYLGDLSVQEIADDARGRGRHREVPAEPGRTALAALLQTTLEADRG